MRRGHAVKDKPAAETIEWIPDGAEQPSAYHPTASINAPTQVPRFPGDANSSGYKDTRGAGGSYRLETLPTVIQENQSGARSQPHTYGTQSPYPDQQNEPSRQRRDSQPTDQRHRSAGRQNPGPSTKRELHSGYKFRRDGRDFFRVGRVFSMLYPDPRGAHPDSDFDEYYYNANGTIATQCELGRTFYIGPRRFIVVRQETRMGRNRSRCVPITTYQGRATTKQGLDPSAHAPFCKKGQEVKWANGEHLARPAIEFIPNDPNLPVNPLSRIDFGRDTQVEWNVEVLDLGMVEGLHKNWLVQHWKEVNQTESEEEETSKRASKKGTSSKRNRSSNKTPGTQDEQSATQSGDYIEYSGCDGSTGQTAQAQYAQAPYSPDQQYQDQPQSGYFGAQQPYPQAQPTQSSYSQEQYAQYLQNQGHNLKTGIPKVNPYNPNNSRIRKVNNFKTLINRANSLDINISKAKPREASIPQISIKANIHIHNRILSRVLTTQLNPKKALRGLLEFAVMALPTKYTSDEFHL
ncbi:MAG: hypothetical protein M1814_005614 [Vezdaea aestivalis]|nr:MAG: hypothetical protein M1814_005614 [Vezdaea aestivalis]